jgi:hypothetical protein
MEAPVTDTPKPVNPNLSTISLGKLNIADDVFPTLAQCGQSLLPFLNRHRQRDREDVDEPSRRANIPAAMHGLHVKSRYRLNDGKLLVVRTNTERNETTIDIEVDLADIWRQTSCKFNT